MVVIPSKMGRLNKRALLDRLQIMGTASRASLSKSLGLSQPTAGKIVDQLIEMGVIEEVEVPVTEASDREPNLRFGKVGRPARMLRLNRTSTRFLGIQLGVSETSITPLPVGVTGEDEWKLRVPTPDSAAGWRAQLEKTAARIKQKSLWGVLVSVPGIVDEKNGRVLFSPNLHWTEGADLTELIQSVWNAPVIVLQEERALALGHEACDPSSDGFLLVDFGEGVGGTIVVGGKLYTNPLPLSGEVGHTPVRGNNRPCGCGAIGCLETLISTRGLLQSFSGNSEGSDWPALVKHISENGVVPWLADTLEAAAVVIAGALNVVGLRRVIVTGSLNELPPAVIRYLSGAISRGAMWGRFGKIDIEGAPRRRIAGLVSVGIDRLVVPMADTEIHRGSLLRLAATQ
jgi:predicted NBD/HSP70 family sugar kinase